MFYVSGIEASSLAPGLQLPHHDSHSYHIVAQKNGKLLLNCSVATNVSQFGKPQVSWYRDGRKIHYDNRLQLVQNGSLYFRRVFYRKKKNITDAGNYECHVKNQIGSIIARRVNLKIASKFCFIIHCITVLWFRPKQNKVLFPASLAKKLG